MLRVGSFVSVAKRDTADACSAAKAPQSITSSARTSSVADSSMGDGGLSPCTTLTYAPAGGTKEPQRYWGSLAFAPTQRSRMDRRWPEAELDQEQEFELRAAASTERFRFGAIRLVLASSSPAPAAWWRLLGRHDTLA